MKANYGTDCLRFDVKFVIWVNEGEFPEKESFSAWQIKQLKSRVREKESRDQKPKFSADWKAFGDRQSEAHITEGRQAGTSSVSPCGKFQKDLDLNSSPLRRLREEPPENEPAWPEKDQPATEGEASHPQLVNPTL